jgi:hypothetical protein
MTGLTTGLARAMQATDRLASISGRTLRVFGPSCGSKVTRVGAFASLWVHGVPSEDINTPHHPVPGSTSWCTSPLYGRVSAFRPPLTLAR